MLLTTKKDQRETRDLHFTEPAHATVLPIPACHLVVSIRLFLIYFLFLTFRESVIVSGCHHCSA